MAGLTPEQIDTLAESISQHAFSKHAAELNIDSREEMVTRIKEMLSDPDTEFTINKSINPERADSIVFANAKTQSILAFNPQQLADPKPDASGNNLSKGDNFAGTFYREPKLNELGEPVSRSGSPVTEAKAAKIHREQVKSLRGRIADDMGTPRSDVEIKKIGDSPKWAEHINKYDDQIKDGLDKAIQRKQAALDVSTPGAKDIKGPISARAVDDATDALSKLGKANKNIAVDIGIGVGVAGSILIGGGNAAEAAEAAAETLNPIPETTDALRHGAGAGDVAEAVAKDASFMAGCVAGGAVGGQVLAAGGAAAGSVVPGAGTAVGAGAGAVVGAVGGCVIGGMAASGITERIINFFRGDSDDISLKEVRDILPDEVTPEMPPELAALVEVQSSDKLLKRQLEELQETNGIQDVAGYLEEQVRTAQSIDPAPDAAVPETAYPARVFTPGLAP